MIFKATSAEGIYQVMEGILKSCLVFLLIKFERMVKKFTLVCNMINKLSRVTSLAKIDFLLP